MYMQTIMQKSRGLLKKTITLKPSNCNGFRVFTILAAGEGFEPSQTESESVVLPLHKPAKRSDHSIDIDMLCQGFYFEVCGLRMLTVTDQIPSQDR